MDLLRIGRGSEAARLGESRRRVLKHARAEKQRRQPDGMQGREGRRKVGGLGCRDSDRRITRFDAGFNNRDRTLVLWMRNIRVEMLVQRRGGSEDEREEK